MTKTCNIGCEQLTLLCIVFVLCLFSRINGQTISDSPGSVPYGGVYSLQKTAVYQQNDVFRYQARCSIPCGGSYAPGTLYITLNLDKVTFNFDAYGNFEASQSISSNIWWIKNRSWLSEINGQCLFDFLFEYYDRYPELTGTCEMGWNMSSECFVPDTTEPIDGVNTCSQIAGYNKSRCYDHYIYSKCCQACSSRADGPQTTANLYCPYGDRDGYTCYGIEQHRCYSQNFTCCGTCKDYEETIPDCQYGNRDPSYCDFLVYADCYNTTIEKNCCYECHGLVDEDRPDCRYGDKATSCISIERYQCYDAGTETTCCQRCGDLRSDQIQGCEYGDRQDGCSDITLDECKNNNNRRDECCQTCHYLEDTDCNGDESSSCKSIAVSTCYNENVRNRCCRQCLKYYDVQLGDACPFGDRLPNFCYNISGNMCYNSDVAEDCCLQCSYYELDHLPQTCQYGNKAECTDTLALQCYQPSIEDRCCETCHAYDSTDTQGFGCRYGDKIDSCYSRPINSCYDENSWNTCCRYCSTVEDLSDPECPYGDKLAMCTTNLVPFMCYNVEDDCCKSCDYMVKTHLGSDCKYGDRRNCSTISRSDCYTDSVANDCCESCYYLHTQNTDCSFGDSGDCSNLEPWDCYSREQECCSSCTQYLINNVPVTCKYGDKAAYCANINSYECYDDNIANDCCERCAQHRRDDLPDNCSYGDKSTICQSENGHGSYCYNTTILDMCCESCLGIQTDYPECLYGDKATYCLDIYARNCYEYATEVTCCVTCPGYYQATYPEGCKYGDKNRNCRSSSCNAYSQTELEDCCNTCRSYITSTDVPTTSTEKSTSDGGDNRKTTLKKPTSGTMSTTTTPKSTETSRDTTWWSSPMSNTRHPVTKYITTPSTSTEDITTNTITTEAPSGFFDSIMDTFGSTGAVIGGVVGGIVVIVIIAVVAFYCIRIRNKNTKSDYKQPRFDSLGANQNQLLRPSGGASAQYNPNGQVSYNNGKNGQPQKRAPPKRQESEEVYDYINPDDVRTVVSMPITRRPTLPQRKEDGNTYEPYLEPVKTDNGEITGYDNLALQTNDKTDENAYHQYYVLEKEPERL